MKSVTLFLLVLISILNSCKKEKTDFEKGFVKTETLAVVKPKNIIIKQNGERKNWNRLDYLNFDKEYRFEYEDSIVGKGIVTISDIDYYKTKFRIQDLNSKYFYIIENTERDIITEFKGKKYNRYESQNVINPRVFITSPDYFTLILDCVEINDKNYVVIVDGKNNKKGLISKSDKNFKFQTFEEFIRDYAALGVDFDRENNLLHKLPNKNSEIIKNDLQEKYKFWNGEFIELKGDWMKMKLEETNEIGWIKWRNGNKILIRIYYIC